ncbi:MAG: biotin transporter BioY [Parachlamydiales bacterium]|nr:biotin transporter BioY [Parachlamydiales bacterium]
MTIAIPTMQVMHDDRVTNKALRVVGASLLIGLCAQIAVELPFTPVPITLHTFAIMLIAAKLGPRLGFMAVMTYVLEGCMGLPVFSGFSSGPGVLFGPTGGYLVGFMLAAFTTGSLLENGWAKSSVKRFFAQYIGSAIILGSGMIWLSHFVGGPYEAFLLGVAPFLFGDVLKNTMVAKITS